MRAPSIGLFSYSCKPRGSVVHTACLAEALAALGSDVTLYALDKDGQGFFRALDARLVLIPARPAPAGSDALIAQRIAEVSAFVRAQAPRHAVFHAQDCLVASGLLAARPDGLLCRTVHHVEQFESAYLESCQARSIRGADLCLSVSQATRAALHERYARESELVHNGVDSARFAPLSGAQRAAVRGALALPEHAPLVLSIGGVEPRKNSLGMLEAFLALHARMPDARWLIVGGASIFEHAEYRAAFEARLAALRPEQRAAVRCAGVLADDQMPSVIGAADVLLHTALREGFGLCVLEAMAAGTPVVVSNGPPFDEFVDASCALMVGAQDVQAMSKALARALSEPRGGRARTCARLFVAPQRAASPPDLPRTRAPRRRSKERVTCRRCTSKSSSPTATASAAIPRR